MCNPKVKNLDDINNIVKYILFKLKTTNILTKEELKESTESFMDVVSTALVDDKSLKKHVSAVYNNTSKYINKYTTILKKAYDDILMGGVVFYSSDDILLDDLLYNYPPFSANTSLTDLNTNSIYDLDIDTYMVVYKASDDVMGLTKFKVNDVNYIHCFAINLLDELDTFSLLLVGSSTNEEGYGLNSLICDRAILCECGKTAICKKVFKSDVECIYRQFFGLIYKYTTETLTRCLSEDLKEDVLLHVKEAIVLRENSNIVSEKTYDCPTLVANYDGDLLVFSDVNNLTSLTRSI